MLARSYPPSSRRRQLPSWPRLPSTGSCTSTTETIWYTANGLLLIHPNPRQADRVITRPGLAAFSASLADGPRAGRGLRSSQQLQAHFCTAVPFARWLYSSRRAEVLSRRVSRYVRESTTPVHGEAPPGQARLALPRTARKRPHRTSVAPSGRRTRHARTHGTGTAGCRGTPVRAARPCATPRIGDAYYIARSD